MFLISANDYKYFCRAQEMWKELPTKMVKLSKA